MAWHVAWKNKYGGYFRRHMHLIAGAADGDTHHSGCAGAAPATGAAQPGGPAHGPSPSRLLLLKVCFLVFKSAHIQPSCLQHCGLPMCLQRTCLHRPVRAQFRACADNVLVCARCLNLSGVSEALLVTKAFAGCHVARYCSPICQKRHWRMHKRFCLQHQSANRSQ